MRLKVYLIIGVSGVLSIWFGGWMLYDLMEIWSYFIPRTFTHILLFSCSIFILGLCFFAYIRGKAPSEIPGQEKIEKDFETFMNTNPDSSLMEKIEGFSDKLSDLHISMKILAEKSKNETQKLQDIDSRLSKLEREDTDRTLLTEVPEKAKKILEPETEKKPKKEEKKVVRKAKKPS